MLTGAPPSCRNGLAFGESPSGQNNGFIGTGDFALSNTTDSTWGDSSWALFLFHWAFSAAAATITAGAVAERITLLVYLGYTCAMSGWVRARGLVRATISVNMLVIHVYI